MKLNTRLNIFPRLRIGGAIPLLSVYAFMEWAGRLLRVLPLTILVAMNQIANYT